MNQEILDKLTRLSQLALGPDEARLALADLSAIVALIDELETVDTEGVAPLAHPLDMAQPLREDVVTEAPARKRHQAGAPLTRDGLYLVPKVVE